jgi:hypothetical protein
MLNGNSAAWRQSEIKPFYEAFAEKVATTIFYGNAGTDPEQFTGLSTRYSSLSAGNGGNIVDAGGTGSDNASIWMIGHGEGFHGIYPKGSMSGLQHEDGRWDAGRHRGRVRLVEQPLPRLRRLVPVEDRDRAARLEERRSHREPRHLQPRRAVVPGNITNQLIKAVNRIQTKQGVKIYMNRTIAQYFEVEQYAAVKGGGGLTYENVDGRPVAHWRGMPIRIVDALLETEARVV